MNRGLPSREKGERLGERKTQVLASATDELSSKQMIFLGWWGQPEDLRFPHLQKDLASQLGVCERTLTQWKKDPLIQTLRAKLVDIHILEYEIPDIKLALIKKAKRGHIMAIKTVLDVFGLTAPKEVTIRHIGIVGVIQEEITNLPENTLKLLAETVQGMQEAGD